MSKNLLIHELEEHKRLGSPAEVAAFDRGLAMLAESPNDDDLPDLLKVFTDECQNYEVMYGLLHFVESFDMEKQLAALLEAIPWMSAEAPEWMNILHYRILNDEASRQCYKKLYQGASSAIKDAAKAVLLKIQRDDPSFSTRVRDLVASEAARSL